ncbi:iron-containing alcohol dehydrogenase family protein [Cupriavidus alkaliphilus]|uniref:iron-containing alcohol dehydrogenase family protein n=1 Tax=Cupriavidus alkaliphilus TaxID=942866 RepID=UPI001614F9B1|nr:iron-containing alcohol dehydrogenase family protein [Cupriavidus alkaliphilus]MBB3014117.1 alcohol dehydrogenase class IV [Cupriavidus alkaliphilus]
MQSFQHITPPLRLFCGQDSLKSLGRELERLGSRRAVVFCGPWAEGQLLEAVRAGMGERCAGVYTGVLAHSPIASVEEAARELKRLDADAVIALGGGSSIVTARAASILLAEDGDPRDLCTTRDSNGQLRSPKLQAPKLPQLIVPTTPTTAMVKAGSAIFDPATGARLALFDPKTRAHAIFIHPEMIQSSPRGLALSASVNTFSMAIEGLTSRSGDPFSDALLMHVLRLLGQHLPGLEAADHPDTRAQLLHAAVMCGQGTDHTGAGITTVLGHAIGARHHMDNGIANAIVLPHVLRFNGTAGEAGLNKVATALRLGESEGESLVNAVVEAVQSLFRRLGIPSQLREVGIPRETLAHIAANAIGDWFLGGNPRPVRDETELLQVLEEAW